MTIDTNDIDDLRERIEQLDSDFKKAEELKELALNSVNTLESMLEHGTEPYKIESEYDRIEDSISRLEGR